MQARVSGLGRGEGLKVSMLQDGVSWIAMKTCKICRISLRVLSKTLNPCTTLLNSLGLLGTASKTAKKLELKSQGCTLNPKP